MNLLLENENSFELDVSDDIKDFLKEKFDNQFEQWLSFGTAFYPANREETLNRFLSLPTNSNVICETVFLDYEQLELLIPLFVILKENNIQINFFCMGLIGEAIAEYYEQSYPAFDGHNKTKLNEQLLEVLMYHSIYQVCSFHLTASKPLKTLEDCKEISKP